VQDGPRRHRVDARLAAVLSRESNPVPAKYALSVMNIISPRVRLPLVELKSETKAEIERVFAHIGAKYSAYMIGDVTRQDRNTVQSVDSARPKPTLMVVS
jgi:hypothetical protein